MASFVEAAVKNVVEAALKIIKAVEAVKAAEAAEAEKKKPSRTPLKKFFVLSSVTSFLHKKEISFRVHLIRSGGGKGAPSIFTIYIGDKRILPFQILAKAKFSQHIVVNEKKDIVLRRLQEVILQVENYVFQFRPEKTEDRNLWPVLIDEESRRIKIAMEVSFRINIYSETPIPKITIVPNKQSSSNYEPSLLLEKYIEYNQPPVNENSSRYRPMKRQRHCH